MTNLPRHTTEPGMSPISTGFDFAIDYITAQGPARRRLSKRFDAEMRNSQTAFPQHEDAFARICLASDIGARPRNEDSAVAMLAHLEENDTKVPIILVAVADGIGGAADGDVASAIAIQTLTEGVVDRVAYHEDRKHNGRLSPSSIEGMLMTVTRMGHDTIKAETQGGGSTLTCALIVDDTAYLAHVGDSRAYLLNPNRQDIELITSDHHLVREWESLGILTAEQAAHHPLSHVLYWWLGRSDQFEVDIKHRKLAAGTCLLLCTDGISNVLSQNDIYRILNHADQPEGICERLIKAAVAHNSHDDASALLVRIPG